MSYETILYDVTDGVARITFNRPDALNAWSRTMGLETLDAVRRTGDDDAARVLVVTGEGRAFSSGADLKGARQLTPEGKPDMGSALQQFFNPLILALRQTPKPIVASVNGPCAGYSVSFACACDFLLAAESAYFMLAFVRIGLIPDGGATAFLPARVGLTRATQLGMLGDRLPAVQALDWGLVNSVHPDDELAAATDELAARLAAGPVRAYAAQKALYNRQLLPGLEDQLGAEAAAQYQRGLDGEVTEGISAFVEKRTADFASAPELV